MKGIVKYVVFLALPVAVVILWLAGVFHPKITAEEVVTETKVVSDVDIGKAELIDVTHYTFTGRVVPEKKVEISTRRSGYVVEVLVDEGSKVKRGQVLLRIDPSDLRSSLEEAEKKVLQAKELYEASLARFRVAKKTYGRFKELFREGAVTEQELDEARAKFEEARASLEAAKIQVEIAKKNLGKLRSELRYVEIRSPIDGYVSKRNVDPGDLAVPGKVLLVVESKKQRVEVDLPEDLAVKLRIGDRVKVKIDTLGKTVPATVVKIEPSLDPSTRTFKVEADLKLEGLKSGMLAKVFIPQEARIVAVPETALYKKWDLTGVWVVGEDGTLSLRFVRTGRRFDGKVEILAGLNGEERIVVRGVERVCEGCRIGGP